MKKTPRRTRAPEQSAAARAHSEHHRQVLQQALAAHQQGDLARAEHLYRTLLDADPGHVDALHMLGVLANQVGQSAVACELIASAIALRPDLLQFQYNYGVVLQAEGRHREAVTAYRKARQVQPKRAALYENLGTALFDCGQSAEALVQWQQALQLDPASAIAHKNLGTHAFNTGDDDAARQHFEQLVKLDPAAAECHEKLATLLLRQRDYASGLDEYEWRFCSPSFTSKNPPAFAPYPKWTGTPLAGKALLISAEQGVGDEVMFSRYFRQLCTAARRCIIECDARLVPLFRRSFADAQVVARGAIPDDIHIDWRISAGSVPRLLRWRPDEEPATAPWLAPDTAATKQWHKRLDAGRGRLNIGISWRGGGDERAQQARSIALEQWREILDHPDVRAVSLQYGDHDAEIDAFNAAGSGQVEQLQGVDPLRDLDGLGALIGALDLVITIDNSTAHVAGAVGTPTWLLLTRGPDWRWHNEATSSPWYPTVRCFRQARSGDWAGVLAQVAQALADHATSAPEKPPVASPRLPRAKSAAQTQPVTAAGPAWVLLNDTSNWYHWGCTATSLAIHDQLRRRGRVVAALPIYAAANLHGVPADLDGFASHDVFGQFCQFHPQLIEVLQQADAVCVNGEGTLHRLSPAALNLLYLIQVCAAHLGKRVHVINHSCYPDGTRNTTGGIAHSLYRSVYANVHRIGVREGESAAVLRAMGLPVIDTFDCLPLYIDRLWQRAIPEDHDYVLLAGCAHWPAGLQALIPELVRRLAGAGLKVRLLLGANAFPASDDTHFARTLLNTCGGDVSVLWTHSESDWLNAIAGARALLSGRFHHSIAAAFTDTPFLVTTSNTPKIDGLLARLGLDNALPFATDDHDPGATLWNAVHARLTTPNTYCLSATTRATLLQLAQRNFVGSTDVRSAPDTQRQAHSPIQRDAIYELDKHAD